MKTIKIGNKQVGDGNPCLIIAEAGVNHNGDVALAEKLIWAAAKAGAEAIKFQTFKAEQVTTKYSPTAAYQKKNAGEDNQWNLLKPLELKETAYPRLVAACKRAGILFLSTPHGHIDSAKLLTPLVPAWKVGSGDLTNLPLLKWLGETGKPIILSTGMATMAEIKAAVEMIESTANKQIIILQCTTNYPCPDNEANIGAMLDIQKHFSQYPVGFSDHTIGIKADILAASLGATVIEKHFTLDRKLPGPDQQNSAEPDELADLVKRVKQAKQEATKITNIAELMGSGKKIPLESELVIGEMARKSVIANIDIPTGTMITETMLTIKRPAKGGLEPKFYWKILGKTSTRDIKIDTQITPGDWK